MGAVARAGRSETIANNQQIMAIVSAALAKQPGPERDAFVQQACAEDAGLLAGVQEALSTTEGFESDTVGYTAGTDPHERIGARIGPYTLLDKLGEGGCGVVYLAEQEEPIRRQVAMKIIKLGMDSREVIVRFEAERQALALMDHPNIARVLDAGTTQSGRPYFIMELVRGIPITRYCDESHLPNRERLGLFEEVCQAIQHAHQKGIIHRDIKPSNVLVTLQDDKPVPKVIDFGIAKATQGKLTDMTIYTALEQFIGTPAYMSPEQTGLSGMDIDTRSDIYSLGVLLYELLIGRPPFEPQKLMQAGVDEARRRIREEDPLKPSTRLRSGIRGEAVAVAACRGMNAPQLIRSVEGDLDWITMKAMEKDRTRRYDSASSFAKDIEHFLKNELIIARPPGRWYRLQKFARRNRAALLVATVAGLAACAVIAALTVGLAVSTWLFIRERQARQLVAEVQQGAELTQAEVMAFGNPELVERVRRAQESVGQMESLTQLLNQGQLDQAEQVMDGLLSDSTGGGYFEAQVLALRADLRARSGRFKEAAEDLTRVVEIDPADHWNWFMLSPLVVHLGDEAKYQSLRTAMLERFGNLEQFSYTNEALVAERLVKAITLRPLNEEDVGGIDHLVEIALAGRDQEQYRDQFAQYLDGLMLCEALASYRHGQYEEAIQSVQPALGSTYHFFVPLAHAVLAMSHHSLGHPLEAKAALDAGQGVARASWGSLENSSLGPQWNDILIADIFLKEAEELLQTEPGSAPVKDASLPE